MHIQYVALCDQVVMGQDARPSLIGVFNDLQVPAVPFTVAVAEVAPEVTPAKLVAL